MKIALSLAGGGARGSYQLGVYNALIKLGLKPDIVTGTSIGSLNGALIAQGDDHLLSEIWSNISKDQIFDNSSLHSIDFSNLKELLFKSNIKPSENSDLPLKLLINKYLDEQKLRHSNIDFGLVCVGFPTLTPYELSLPQIPQGYLHKYLQASCSIYPALPMTKIDDKLHVDGVFHDNLPINLAFNMGASKVIAVDLASKPYHPHHIASPLVDYIVPSRSLGQFLSFDKTTISNNQSLGYNDALKHFDRAYGFKFTFRRPNVHHHELEASRFCKHIHQFESKTPAKSTLVKTLLPHPLSSILKYKEQHSTRDFYLRGAETCLDILKVSPYKIYDITNINTFLLNRFLRAENFVTSKLFSNVISFSPSIDREQILGCILHYIIQNGIFADNIYLISTIFPRETLGAFYLFTLYESTLPAKIN